MKKAFIALMILSIVSCARIASMQEHVVNYIKSSELGLNIDPNNINSDQRLNYYYIGNMLYIADNANQRIIGLNASNQIFFELGNQITHKETQSESWQKEIYDLMGELQERNQLKSQQNSFMDINLDHSGGQETALEMIRSQYRFQKIGNIAVDNRHNIYIEHIIEPQDKRTQDLTKKEDPKSKGAPKEPSIEELMNRLPENNSLINAILAQNSKNQNIKKEVEILKFSSKGEFLYRIGEEGRDNPNFKGNISILNFFFNKDNGTVWVRYLKDGQIYIRLYTGFGKNILFFEESKISAALQPHMKNEGNLKYKYKIEDVYPLPMKRQVMVIVDTFDMNNLYKVSGKEIFILNSDYVVEDIHKIKNPDSQVYSVTNEGNIYFLSYNAKENNHIIELYDLNNNLILRKNIDFQFSYYKRLGIDVTSQGDLMGLFLRKDDFLFVLWK